MQELKATEVKKKNSLKVELLAIQVAYLLPLANSFNFNPSFLILPDIIFNNTSIPVGMYALINVHKYHCIVIYIQCWLMDN